MIDIRSRILARRELRTVFNGNLQDWGFPANYRCFGNTATAIHIAESSPAIHTLLMVSRSGGGVTYTLAFPYVQYYAIYYHYYHSYLEEQTGPRLPQEKGDYKTEGVFPFVTWSEKSLKSCEDKVDIPLLPNVYGSSYVCMGSSFSKSNTVRNICRDFWTIPFAPEEMTWPYISSLPCSELISFENWEKMTKRWDCPDFMLDLVKGHTTFFELQSGGYSV